MTERQSIWNRLRGGSLRQGTVILGSGAAISLLVSYATQIVLARLYTASEFGVADSFIAIVAIMSPVAGLRYEDAIMLPKEDSEARSVLHLTLGLTIATVLITAIAVLPFGTAIGLALGSEQLGAYLWLLPIALFVHRGNELLEIWKVRNRCFGRISTAHILRTSITSATRIGAGLTQGLANASGLIGGFIAGFVVSAVALAGGRNGVPVHVAGDWTRSKLTSVARRFKRFPMFTMPATLLASLNSRAPFLLLLFLFDEEVVGYFGRAFVAVAIPLTLLGTAVSRVFFVEASERVREGSVTALTLAVYERLVSLAIVPLALLVVAGPELFRLVFGPDWTEAGRYAQILVAWFVLAGITSPLTRLFDVLERQRLDLVTGVIGFALLAAAFVSTANASDISSTLIVLAIAGFAARLIQLVVLLMIANVNLRDALRPWLISAAAVAPLCLITYYTRSSGIALLSGCLVGSVFYLSTLVILDLRKQRS